MDNEHLVSIIMPVHNSEQHITPAIDSILAQTYSNWELIIIDDGSTDCSPSICKAFASLDNRITLLHNTSSIHDPGTARNIGLDHMHGQYLFFMDSDDWIEPDLLQNALDTLLKSNSDLVQFGFFDEHSSKQISHVPPLPKEVITRQEIQQDFLTFWNHTRFSLWMYLFKTSLIGSLRFQAALNGEDISFMMDVFCSVNQLSYLSKPLYHYRILEGSVSHKWIDHTIEYRCMIWHHEKKFLDSFHDNITEDVYAELAISNYIWAAYHLCAKYCPLTLKQKKSKLELAEKEIQLSIYRKQCTLKNHSGLEKIKYALVKFHLEYLMLLLGPVFLRVIRNE